MGHAAPRESFHSQLSLEDFFDRRNAQLLRCWQKDTFRDISFAVALESKAVPRRLGCLYKINRHF
jgi:hypothetical protein